MDYFDIFMMLLCCLPEVSIHCVEIAYQDKTSILNVWLN